ncbi:hypothetical protein BDB01DRAFT_839096 [Pilobolus umbonatus]|nr:hypothetical protein BDB01DRAFT_839096 [Pilobolus umbonatus]
MCSIPLEIIKIILTKSNTSDLYTFLTVCKSWYFLTIPHLYETIHIKEEEKLQLFFKSITAYPHCMQAANHVRSLNMTAMIDIMAWITKEGKIKDFLDAFLHCPNIEILYITAQPHIVNHILKAEVPILRNIKKLVFTKTKMTSKVECIRCLFKFRSTLTYLDVKELLCSPSDYTTNKIISYLQLYPQLIDLLMDCNHKLIQNSPLFQLILDHCTQLTSLTYILNGRLTLSEQVENTYPSLVRLDLQIDHLHLQDMFYLKSRLTGLRNMKLTINNTLLDDLDAFSVLLDWNQLHQLDFTLVLMDSTLFREMQYTLSRYLKHRHKVGRGHHKLSFHYINTRAEEISLRLCMVRCPITGSTHMKCRMGFYNKTELSYEDWLKVFGPSLNHLKIRDDHYEAKTSLKTINAYCPVLTQLELDVTKLIHLDVSYSPNHSLHDLNISHCHVDDATLREIESVYPRLQKLYLNKIRLTPDCVDNALYTLRLPETKLKYLVFKQSEAWLAYLRLVVTRQQGEHIEQLWFFCLKRNDIIRHKNWSLQQIQNRLSKPIILLKSSSIEHVQVKHTHKACLSF